MTQKNYAIIGMLTPVAFWILYSIMSFMRPEYSFKTYAISELGSLDAPNKWIWNVFGHIVVGMLLSIYSFGLFKGITGKKRGNKLPFIAFAISGFCMALTGIFPADMNNLKSITSTLHIIFSNISYVFFLVGAFTYPKQMKKTAYWSKAIKPTLVFTWMTILFGAWRYIFTDIPSVGQRFVFFFYLLWVFYTAFKLYKQKQTTLPIESPATNSEYKQ